MKIEAKFSHVLGWVWRWVFGKDAEASELTLRDYLYRQRSKYANALQSGAVLKSQDISQRKHEERCNHCKGGYIDIKTGKLSNTTDIIGQQMCVIKHQMADGSWYIRCIRCGKTWKPGTPGYTEAVLFPTRNISSGAIQVRFLKTDKHGVTTDDTARYRAAIANS
jgi:hypothetical protein